MVYDFDQIIERRGSACVKWDVTEPFGQLPPGSQLTPFWIADMDFPVLPEITLAMEERCRHPVWGYNIPTPGGMAALCGWFQRRHGWSFTPDEVIPGIGVVTVLRFAIEAVTTPGDKILVFSPVYDPFFALVKNTGRELVDLPLVCENNAYYVDYAALEDALKDGVKAIIFCNPHNPIGKVWTKDELGAIADLCAKYRVVVLSDEVHGDIVMRSHSYTSMGVFEQIRDLTAVFTSVSKAFNLAGLSASCTVVPDKELRGRINKALKGAWIMGPNALAFPAMEAAYTYGDLWIDELNAYLDSNAAYVVEQVSQSMPKVAVSPLQGTYLMWMDFNRLGMDSDSLTAVMAREYGIGLGNGGHYGNQCEGFMRFNIACPRKTLKKGVEGLKRLYHSKGD